MAVYWRRSLSSDVFEPRASTRSGLFALLSRDFEQTFGQIVSKIVKTLSNTNLVALRHTKEKKAHFRLTWDNQKRHCLNFQLTETKLGQYPAILQQGAQKGDLSSHSFMQTLTNQKSRTVSSWLLIGWNLYERMWINKKRSHFWAPCCSQTSLVNNRYYHSMQIFLPFHWLKAHHVTCK